MARPQKKKILDISPVLQDNLEQIQDILPAMIASESHNRFRIDLIFESYIIVRYTGIGRKVISRSQSFIRPERKQVVCGR